MKTRRIAAGLLLCLGLAALTACNARQPAVTVETVKVTRGDIAISVTGSGNVNVAREANLGFGVGGRVTKINVAEGDNVTAGSLLASLDTGNLDLAVSQAAVAVDKAQLDVNTAEYDLKQAIDNYRWPALQTAKDAVTDAEDYVDYVEANLKAAATPEETASWTATLAYAQLRVTLAQQEVDKITNNVDTDEVAISRVKLEIARDSLAKSQQALQYAQKRLKDAAIVAPFSGTVVDVFGHEGDILPSATTSPVTIVHMVDLRTMELEVELDERDVPSVKLGQRAIITADALPGVTYEGRVTFIAPAANQAAGLVQYNTRTSFDVPPGSGLKVGMSASADLVVQEHDGVLLLSNRAIKHDSRGNAFVMVMVDGQTQSKQIVTGLTTDLQTEIVSGLNEGDSVII